MTQCDGYYRCLLELTTLAGFHEHPDFPLFRNIHFMALLRNLLLPPMGHHILAIGDAPRDAVGVPLVAEHDRWALEDLMRDGEPGDVPLDDDVAMPASMVGALPEHEVPAMDVPPVRFLDGVVYFDNCTHASGMRRAFVGCSNPLHGRCDKYQFVHHYESSDACVAWLAAWWDLSDTTPEHNEHLDMVPSDESIAWRLASLL